MAQAIVFDTLAYAKKLIAAGVPEKQAEIQAETFAEIIEERIATKNDLAALEMRLKYDLTLRLGTMLAAAVAVIAALIKLL